MLDRFAHNVSKNSWHRARWKITSMTAGHCGRLHLNVMHFKISGGRWGGDLTTGFEEDPISSVDKFFDDFV